MQTDISLPEPPQAGTAAAQARSQARAAAGILIGLPAPGDPPGTTGRFAWPIPGSPWIACGRLARRGDVLEVRSLEVISASGEDAATSDLMRRISVPAILAAARAHYALMSAAATELADMTGTDPGPETRKLATVRPAGAGRPRLPDPLLRDTAQAYLAEAAGGPGIHDRIARTLQATHGRPFTGIQVRNAITRAEKAGWLSAGKPGSARRGPGPRMTGEENAAGTPAAKGS